MQNYADNQVVKPLPAKTLMRKSMTMHNPTVIKSGTDGKVYKRTGNVISADFVRPKGRVYVAPTTAKISGYDVIKPFEKVMDKALKNKGLTPPPSLEDKSKLFFNQIVAAKGFNQTKPMNFEAYDSADASVPDTVIPNLLTYFKSLINDVKPDGTPLATQDQKLAQDAKAVVQDLSAKVANAGLSPQDAAAAGAHLSNVPPVTEPFYKKSWFMWVAGAIVVFVVIKFVF